MTHKNILCFKAFEIILFCLATFLFVNCQKTIIEPRTYLNVAPELCPYFQQFEVEAAARGVKIDLKIANISGRIVSIRSGEAGVCATTERT